MNATIGTIRINSGPIKADPLYGFHEASGYFGEHLPGDEHKVRTVFVDGDPSEEAEKMFRQLAKGGKIARKANGNVIHAELSDGTTLDLRVFFSSRPSARGRNRR